MSKDEDKSVVKFFVLKDVYIKNYWFLLFDNNYDLDQCLRKEALDGKLPASYICFLEIHWSIQLLILGPKEILLTLHVWPNLKLNIIFDRFFFKYFVTFWLSRYKQNCFPQTMQNLFYWTLNNTEIL